MKDPGDASAAFGVVVLMVLGAWMWGFFVPPWLWVLTATLGVISAIGMVESKRHEEARQRMAISRDLLLNSHFAALRHLREANRDEWVAEDRRALALQQAVERALQELESGSKGLEATGQVSSD